MSRLIRLVTVLAVMFMVAGCTSDDDPADEIHGTWLVPGDSVYEQFAEDGTWGVWPCGRSAGLSHAAVIRTIASRSNLRRPSQP